MSQPLAAVTITAGKTSPIPCGPAPAVGAVVLYNESPYAVQVRAGSKGGWLPAWTGDKYETGNDAAWDGTIIVTPQALASNTGQAPSFSILPVTYGSGEYVPGTYPCSLTRQVQQGQIVTAVTQVIQDAQTSGQVIMEATPLVGGQTILVTTDGIAEFVGGVRFGPSAGGSFPFVFFNSGNHENEYSAPQGGSANGHLFVEWDGAAQQIPLSIGSTGVAAKTNITHAGAIFQLAGQLTAGSFGVPPIVASTPQAGVAVSATTQQTIIASMSVPAGLYRIAGAVNLNNGTSGQHINFTLHGPGATGANMWTFTSSTAIVAMDGSTDTLTNGLWNCIVQSFAVVASGNISVTYQDPGGTPNDTVWCVIEKMC